MAHHSHPFAGQREVGSRCGRDALLATLAIECFNTTHRDDDTGHSPCLKRGACREDKLPTLWPRATRVLGGVFCHAYTLEQNAFHVPPFSAGKPQLAMPKQPNSKPAHSHTGGGRAYLFLDMDGTRAARHEDHGSLGDDGQDWCVFAEQVGGWAGCRVFMCPNFMLEYFSCPQARAAYRALRAHTPGKKITAAPCCLVSS